MYFFLSFLDIKEKLWKQFQRQKEGQEVVALGPGNDFLCQPEWHFTIFF